MTDIGALEEYVTAAKQAGMSDTEARSMFGQGRRGEARGVSPGELAREMEGGPPALKSEMAASRAASNRRNQPIFDKIRGEDALNRLHASRFLANKNTYAARSAIQASRTLEYRDAYLGVLGGVDDSGLRTILRAGQVESRDLTEAGTAGLTIPQAFHAALTKSLLQGSPVRDLAQVVETPGGAAMKLPIVDDTSNVAAILAENSAVPNTTDPSLTQASLGAFPWIAPAVLLPWSLVFDSGLDVLSILGEIAADRISRGQDVAFCTGSGSGTCLGVVPGTTVGATTALNTTISYADWQAAFFSLRPAYRGRGAAWLMHSSTFKSAINLVDAQGAPVFVEARERGTLFGLPVRCDDNVASFAASAKVAVVGRFDLGYMIRDVAPPISVILHERYADSLNSAVICGLRTDATVTDAAALRVLQVHA